jgi:hypothetical protein
MSAHDQFSLAEIDIVELRAIMKSPEAFIEYFLADEMGDALEVVDFHLMVFQRFVDLNQTRDVAALPRDHAKTTMLRLAFVYMFVYSPLEFFVYMGSVHAAACTSLQVIWDTVSSPEFEEVFGEIEPHIIRNSEGYYEFTVNCCEDPKNPYKKRVILKALGAQQTVRGLNVRKKRPQFVGCDDIEDETAVKTQDGYIKFKSWFDNTFMRAVSRERGKNKVVQIGNLIGLQTLLNDNLNDPDWRSIRYGILRANGKPLWEARFSLAEIRKDLLAAQRRGQLSGWFAELMNMPLNMETSLIDYERITWSARRHYADGRKYHSFITIDPAISQKTSADDCAIVLHTIDATGLPQISEYVYASGISPERMTEIVKDMCLRWDCHVVGVESVQLQKVLLHYFRLAFSIGGMMDYEFVPIEVGHTQKVGRLLIWASALTSGNYSLCEADWDVTNQLLQFDRRKDNNKDDLIDACSMGMIMLDSYLHIIFKARLASIGQIPKAILGSTTRF